MHCIWKEASQSLSNREIEHYTVPDSTHSMHRVGWKVKHYQAELLETLMLVPCKHCFTLCKAAHPEQIILTCSTVPRPLLTDTHCENRVQLVRERILELKLTIFKSQFNVIH